MREKAVDTYPSRLMHVSNCFKTQKMCRKDVKICLFKSLLIDTFGIIILRTVQ